MLIRKYLSGMFILMSAISLSVCLTGCGTEPVNVVYKTTVIAPEDAQLRDCEVAPPPDKALYPTWTPKQKEKALMDLATVQYKNTSDCNIRLSKMRQWKIDTKALYEKPTTIKGN